MTCVLRKFFLWLIICNQCLILAKAVANQSIEHSVDSNYTVYEPVLEQYAKQTKVISGGRYGGSQISIRVGGYGFYENIPDSMGTIGLYVVAIYKDEVLLKYHYNTYFDEGASEGFARDIEKLPNGTFIVIAAKEEPTRHFDKRGQEALYQIGAQNGLLDQEYRTSYLCLGVKGLDRGKAIEKVGREKLSYIGPECDKLIKFTFPDEPKPKVVVKPGEIQRMMIGQTEVLYYIPKYFDPNTAEYLFCIHGAGGSGGAWTKIDEFRVISDIKNFVLIPAAIGGTLNAWPNMPKGVTVAGVQIFLESWATAQSGEIVELAELTPLLDLPKNKPDQADQ